MSGEGMAGGFDELWAQPCSVALVHWLSTVVYIGRENPELLPPCASAAAIILAPPPPCIALSPLHRLAVVT